MTPSRAIRFAVILLILGATVGCDQVSKKLARTELGRAGSRELPGGFVELTLAENRGAFLSMGASLSKDFGAGVLIAVVSAGLTLLLAFLMGSSRIGWFSLIGLGLVWAGGISNLIDRFTRNGFVTDFILIRVGPLHTGIFNVADIAIMVGLLVVIASMRASKWMQSTSPIVRK
jgi:signal peptidase II